MNITLVELADLLEREHGARFAPGTCWTGRLAAACLCPCGARDGTSARRTCPAPRR